MKIIILNGPPSSGKDSLANTVIAHDNNFATTKFAYPIKEAVRAFFSLTKEQFDAVESNPELKNQKHPIFLGKSYRDACIDIAEIYGKPVYGKEVFGQILANRILNMGLNKNSKENIIVSDGGFDEEIAPLIEEFGPETIHIIKLFRKGTDFKKDSRGYIDCEKLGIKNEYHLHNVKLDTYLHEGYKLVQAIAKGTARPVKREKKD